MRVGVVADTHGLLRPEVLERLGGVACILHASGIGAPDIVPRLKACRAGHEPGPSAFALSRSPSLVQRRRPEAWRTASARARRWPTSTTRRLPRVSAV